MKTAVKLPTVSQTLRRVGACGMWREWAIGRQWRETYEGVMAHTLRDPFGLNVSLEKLRANVVFPLLARKDGMSVSRLTLAQWERYAALSDRFMRDITWRKFRNLLLAPRGSRA